MSPRPTPRMPALSELLRTPAALDYSQLSRRTLYRLAEQGRLSIYKIGATRYWSITELDSLVTRTR